MVTHLAWRQCHFHFSRQHIHFTASSSPSIFVYVFLPMLLVVSFCFHWSMRDDYFLEMVQWEIVLCFPHNNNHWKTKLSLIDQWKEKNKNKSAWWRGCRWNGYVVERNGSRIGVRRGVWLFALCFPQFVLFFLRLSHFN